MMHLDRGVCVHPLRLAPPALLQRPRASSPAWRSWRAAGG